MEYGDKDAIVFDRSSNHESVCYFEVQHASAALAAQLHHRYRPTHVLLDLKGHAAAEAVAMLACNRIGVVFVPIDVHNVKRLETIVSTLHSNDDDKKGTRIVAVARCDNDADPMISTLEREGIYNVVYVNETGDLLEPMDVPQSLPNIPQNDDLYILFTSGTSGNVPKAVVGSQSSTLHRLTWFHEKFSSSSNTIVARRSKLTFVDSITELFSALLFPPNVLHAFLSTTLEEQGVECILHSPCTQVTMLPSQLEQLLLLPLVKNHSLETIIISGRLRW